MKNATKYLWKKIHHYGNIIIYLCIKILQRKKKSVTYPFPDHIQQVTQTSRLGRLTGKQILTHICALNGCCGYLAVACSLSILWSSYLWHIYTHTFGNRLLYIHIQAPIYIIYIYTPIYIYWSVCIYIYIYIYIYSMYNSQMYIPKCIITFGL